VYDLIGNPLDKRRAERFAELLDTAEGGLRRHNHSGHDDELTPLVDVSHALSQAAPAVATASAPDPDFQAALRQRLMAVATVQGIGATAESDTDATPDEDRKTSGRKRVIVTAALTAGVLGLSGVSTASGDALPGDTLYPVKRSTERAQLALAGSDVNRGQLHFQFARTRLSEAEEIANDAPALEFTLSDMDSEIAQGMQALTTAAVERQDSGVLDAVDDFLAEQTPRVTELMTTLTDESYGHAADSLEQLNAAAERSADLRNSLLCTATADLAGDELGPLPGKCSALPGGVGGQTVSPDQPAQATPDSTRDERGQEQGQEHDKGNGSSSGKESEHPSPDKPDAGDHPGQSEPSPTDGNDKPSEKPDDDEDDSLLDDLGDVLSGLLGN
jgi:hypothetical protein